MKMFYICNNYEVQAIDKKSWIACINGKMIRCYVRC
jgi:hypothetical protein